MTRGYIHPAYGIMQVRGGERGDDALKQFLEDALTPLDLSDRQYYDILFNTLLVAAGARTATLVESAGYGMETHKFEGIVRALQSAPLPSHVKQAFRKGAETAPQYLVYSTALPDRLVKSALDLHRSNSTVAMGKVLGFQCAGELASPYNVRFSVYPDDGGEGYEFYVEVCKERPDEDVAKAMQQKFNAVAARYGWDVQFRIQYVMPLDDMLAYMQTHSAAELDEQYRDMVLETLDGEMLTELEQFLQQQKQWDESTIEWPLVVAALISTQHTPLSVLYGNMTTAEAEASHEVTSRAEQMLLPAFRRELKSRRVAEVKSLTALLALLAQHDMPRVNEHRADMLRLLAGTKLEGVVDMFPDFTTTRQLDALYVLIVFRVLHDASDDFMDRILDIDPDVVELEIHELAYKLFDQFAEGLRGGGCVPGPGSMPRTLEVIIPAKTLLYRAADNICLFMPETIEQQRQQSTDHADGKVGVYFATYPLLSVAMAPEYGKELELGVFCTTADIRAYIGKYAQPTGNHFDHTVGTLSGTVFDLNVARDLHEGGGELFIQEPGDLRKIKLQATYKVSLEKLLDFWEAHSYARHDRPDEFFHLPTAIYDLPAYVTSGALVPLTCATSATGRKSRNRWCPSWLRKVRRPSARA